MNDSASYNRGNVYAEYLNRTLAFINDNISAIAFISYCYSVTNEPASALTLHVNMKYYADRNAHDVNSSASYNRGNVRAEYLYRTLAFINDNISAIAFISYCYSVTNEPASALTLHVNMKYYADRNAHDVNSSASYNRGNVHSEYLDRTLAHELTHGISDERRQDIKALANNPDKLFAALNHIPDASLVKVDGVRAPVYATGFMPGHYFAKKVAVTR